MNAGRELDAIIAEKIMDWKWYPVTGNDEQRALAPSPVYAKEIYLPGDLLTQYVPHYSTEIADAWLIVEKMVNQEFTFMLHAPGIRTEGDGYYKYDQWHAIFQQGAQEAAPIVYAEGEAEAATPMLAICLAGHEAQRQHKKEQQV